MKNRALTQGLNTQGYNLKTTFPLPAVVSAWYTPEDSSPKYYVWLRNRPFLCDLGRSGVSAVCDPPVSWHCGVPKVMRCLRPSHHAANIGISSSDTRTARNTIKGIRTGDGTMSCGRGVGIIMDGEHRCVDWRTNGVVGRFWELLQDLWTTPESLKTNPQLPYNPA